MEIEKVMDRKKIAENIHSILDAGSDLLKKKKFEAEDHSKIKVIRTMGPALNAAVLMVQQETAQQRLVLITERMKQLGYGEPKQLS
uniref:Uncharacterized protein n=1 Tax=viral metagenome TaxID=1070528 RepID=A0A6M3IQA0_9ZZZZ